MDTIVDYRFEIQPLCNPDPFGLAEEIIDSLSQRLITPKSMEVGLPGYATSLKLDRSIDGARYVSNPASAELLNGETLDSATGLTFVSVDASQQYFDWQRDRPVFRNAVATMREKAIPLSAKFERSEADFEIRYWGPAYFWHRSPDGELKKAWTLRERLDYAAEYVACMRVIYDIWGGEFKKISLAFYLEGSGWSHVWKRYDDERGEWCRKEDIRAEQRNAREFAEIMRSLIATLGETTFTWSFWGDRPDRYCGNVPDELERQFGPMNTVLQANIRK